MDGLFFSEAGAKVSERERSLCKLGLVNLRQFQAFLSVLLEELIACNNRLAKLDQDLLSESSSYLSIWPLGGGEFCHFFSV